MSGGKLAEACRRAADDDFIVEEDVTRLRPLLREVAATLERWEPIVARACQPETERSMTGRLIYRCRLRCKGEGFVWRKARIHAPDCPLRGGEDGA